MLWPGSHTWETALQFHFAFQLVQICSRETHNHPAGYWQLLLQTGKTGIIFSCSSQQTKDPVFQVANPAPSTQFFPSSLIRGKVKIDVTKVNRVSSYLHQHNRGDWHTTSCVLCYRDAFFKSCYLLWCPWQTARFFIPLWTSIMENRLWTNRRCGSRPGGYNSWEVLSAAGCGPYAEQSLCTQIEFPPDISSWEKNWIIKKLIKPSQICMKSATFVCLDDIQGELFSIEAKNHNWQNVIFWSHSHLLLPTSWWQNVL